MLGNEKLGNDDRPRPRLGAREQFAAIAHNP
jgi:hypothetical protein